MAQPQAAPVSGIDRLNADLSLLGDRIILCSNRVGSIANSFGSPAVPDPDPRPANITGPVSTTNEHIARLNRLLIELENVISRIDG